MRLFDAKRIVLKVGSSLLVNLETGRLNQKWLASLVKDIASCLKSEQEIVIVSSGAIALGKSKFNFGKRALKLEEKQAAAACGQLALINAYQKSLAKYGLSAAQVLLTLEDSEDRRRYLNAKSTLETLIENKIVPIINENDTVATSEIRFGDNDRLAARVAQMVGADILVLFSDIDGLYTADPRINDKAKHIAEIKLITREVEEMAGGAGSSVGSGGMTTKIAAAKIAVASGCNTIIALGKEINPIKSLTNRTKYTIFRSSLSPQNARKRWIAHNLNIKGEIMIDNGALSALKKGKSLLPSGVKSIEGNFSRGDAVIIRDDDGEEIARGLIAYDAKDAKLIIGRKSGEIEQILGYSGREELIHRDNLALSGEIS